MAQIGLLFALKVVTLIGALAQTVGFVGLFAFEDLAPYKWQLLIGGTALIAVSEGLGFLLVRRMAAAKVDAELNGDGRATG